MAPIGEPSTAEAAALAAQMTEKLAGDKAKDDKARADAAADRVRKGLPPDPEPAPHPKIFQVRDGTGMNLSAETPEMLEGALDTLQQYGLNIGSDEDVKVMDAFIAGKPVPRAVYEGAKVIKARLMADAEWVKRYMAGDQRAQAEMMIANLAITSGPEEEEEEEET